MAIRPPCVRALLGFVEQFEGGKKMLLLGVLLASLVLSDLVVGGEVKGVGQQCSFPAIYNFGDSNSDTGSYSAAVLAVREPCGETFFGKPVGRVCDGRLIIDFIGMKLSKEI